jgi:quercetin dioxygenase-like cupin family protein
MSSGLESHALPKDINASYNPEWTPDGNEGGVDCNSLPWIAHPRMPGFSLKPLRVSRETGQFTILMRAPGGSKAPPHVLIGAQDMFVLSGKIVFKGGPAEGELGPGCWSYLPAGTKVAGMKAPEDTEFLLVCYSAVGFLGPGGEVTEFFSGMDVRSIAKKAGIPLLPGTLAEAMEPAPPKYSGKGDALAINDPAVARICSHGDKPAITELANPHVVDTNAIPWIVDPAAPEIGIKVMRVSHETGHVSLMVRQNGQAPPHYHLGNADFFIISGRIGYRAGPKEGYGPGTYMFEPAGARHEATQRVTDEDLIYTANVYGPIQFDSGVGTPVAAVQSWMQYLQAAEAFKSPLIANTLKGSGSNFLRGTGQKAETKATVKAKAKAKVKAKAKPEATTADPEEKRVDPEDGTAYTFEELCAFYTGKFKKKAIQAYWDDECKPIKRRGRKGGC